mgnify:CR=1 FL=1
MTELLVLLAHAVAVLLMPLAKMVAAAEQRIERLKSEISVLKADRAFLARPTRVPGVAGVPG